MSNKKYLYTIGAIATAIIFVLSTGSQGASAHQRQLFSIGDKDYLFVVGSANEPIFVDDKSGVDFFAYQPDPSDPLNSRANGTKPIEGLEKTLKVEISAGDKKKVLDLEPAFRDPGHYEAPFFPTVETTFNYRLFGNINGTAFNATWTCSPAGGESAPASNNATVQMSEGVTRKAIQGSFGCPQSKTDAGFPEPFMSNEQIVNKFAELENVTKGQ